MIFIKKNRSLSFVAVSLVYILAMVVGVVTFRALSFDFWINLLIADILATSVTFIFSLIFDNASV